MGKKLDAKETIFVAEYLVHLDARKAALAAGYSASVANSKAYQWVRNSKIKPHVFAAVEEAKQRRVERTEISADRVLEEIAQLAFINMDDYMRVGADGEPYVDLSATTRAQKAGLLSFKHKEYKDGRGEDARDVCMIEIRLNPGKLTALIKLGEHVGLFSKDKAQTIDITEYERVVADEALRKEKMTEIAQRYLLAKEPKEKVRNDGERD